MPRFMMRFGARARDLRAVELYRPAVAPSCHIILKDRALAERSGDQAENFALLARTILFLTAVSRKTLHQPGYPARQILLQPAPDLFNC